MKINLPVLYNQQDSRWANVLLGFNTDTKYNFYNYACLLCSFASVSRYFGKAVDPISLNDKLKALGGGAGFTIGSGEYIYGAITKVFSDIKEKLVNAPMPLTDAQLGEIRSAIDDGYPVIVQIDYNPRTVYNDMHFVTLVDYNVNDENDFTIFDPIGGVYKSLKAYLGWLKPSARKTIEKYLVMRGPVPAQSGNTVAVDSRVFPVIVHGSGEWDKSVGEYLPGNDPRETNFPDIQRVVNGYKSDATASKTRANELESKLSIANTEITNLNDKVANIESKCQRDIELKNAEIIALKQAQPNIDKLKSEYLSKIGVLEEDLRDLQKANGIQSTKITELETKLKQAQNDGETLNAFEKLIQYVKRIWQR